MLRVRRYRIFIVFAVIAIGLLYHFRHLGGIEARNAGVEGLKKFGGHEDDSSSTTTLTDAKPDRKPYIEIDNAKGSANKAYKAVSATALKQLAGASSSSPSSVPSTFRGDTTPSPSAVTASTSKSTADRESTSSKEEKIAKAASVPAEPHVEYESAGQGRLEVAQADDSIPKIHWKKQKEHFPIPTESLIQLPTGSPKTIPKIQATFRDESVNEKIDREKKLDTIKKAFKSSWAGYRKKAWMHDELSPVSGQYRDPFCGWAATLVDSLDTLWMMGLKSEFEEAVKAVEDIDFTTSIRNDIPVFETVIRYLGGLIAAYDLGGRKYKILLDKAVELADILMGSFDTPDRMPMTFYLWKPAFASQPHRANTRVILAELGSLSVEFTRLAQITKEAKYYDAIARITNEFDLWQNNTRIPGLWPKKVDASGCRKEDTPFVSPIEHSIQKGPGVVTTQQKVEKVPDSIPEKVIHDDGGAAVRNAGLEKHMIKTGTGSALDSEKKIESTTKGKTSDSKLGKRQLEAEPLGETVAHPEPQCKPQGLNSPPYSAIEEFTLGGQADSVYEYLPKEYLLLGGLEPQYQKMYEAAVEPTKKYLLYRPMIPDEKRKILFAGQVSTSGKLDDKDDVKLKAEGTHLACFVGGMFAMGAKIFNREEDLELAKQLTDGCVWAYESTTTGIMPEGFLTLPCESQEQCAWNETRYWEELDPLRATRETSAHHQAVLDEKKATIDQKTNAPSPATASTASAEQEATSTASQAATSTGEAAQEETSTPKNTTTEKPAKSLKEPSLAKRQLGDVENDAIEKSSRGKDDTEAPSESAEPSTTATASGDTNSETTLIVTATPSPEATKQSIPQYTPPPIPTQEQYAKARIRDDRIPPGIVRITGYKYILRPEAIESVFILWRITGDVYWRQKGWDMFTAIHKATIAEYGASAINDVTAETPQALDEMESFWLAETLKYFYLLFSDPGLVSLDDYVLNTEAHPFRRPK